MTVISGYHHGKIWIGGEVQPDGTVKGGTRLNFDSWCFAGKSGADEFWRERQRKACRNSQRKFKRKQKRKARNWDEQNNRMVFRTAQSMVDGNLGGGRIARYRQTRH